MNDGKSIVPVFMAVGILPKKIPFMSPAGRVLQCHVLSYITRGEGFFENECNTRISVSPGSALYQFPGLWHCFDPLPRTHWKEYWLMFDGKRATECFGLVLPERPAAIQIGIIPDVLEAWEELYDIWCLRQPGYMEYTHYLVHKILVEAYCRHRPQIFQRMDVAVNQLRHEMRSHLHENQFDVEGSAQARHMGYDQLRKRFKRSTGLAPKEYFLLLKINRAKELLMNPTLSVKEISQQLGFSDQYYFSRLFKHRTGTSPLHYRRHLLKYQLKPN